MGVKIFFSLFVIFGFTFLFSGCSKDEIDKALNTAPVATAQTITVAQDSLDNNITLSASDVDGDTLIFSIETNTTNGILGGTAPNLIYTPTVGYSGTDSFTFKANDSLVDSNITTLSIVVNPPHNQLPIANAGADQIIAFGNDVTLDASLSTDDGTIVSYVWSENSTQLSSTISFTKSDFTVGVHTITLTVTDNQGAAAIDEVTINVNAPANLIPTSSDQNVTTDENVDINITLSATDGDSTDTLTYIIVTNPTNGSLSSLIDNNVTYTPTIDYNGTDSFTFKVNDGTVDSNIATINITINNVLKSLLKTGQTMSYTNFDDGYYQTGATRSYSRDNINNIVTDNTTGLVWQDDITPASMNWSDALAYCTNLTLGGFTNWKLPAIKDLQTIVDDGEFNPTINSIFQNTNSGASRYWSSTTLVSNTSFAWSIYFYASYIMSYNKVDSRYIRCVRIEQ
ncbi:MAG: DUF1566 domain-containing protein [Sulfurimonas sp.]|nr:DUF1566 domain-containing protein [Sulfurimonas sp.]